MCTSIFSSRAANSKSVCDVTKYVAPVVSTSVASKICDFFIGFRFKKPTHCRPNEFWRPVENTFLPHFCVFPFFFSGHCWYGIHGRKLSNFVAFCLILPFFVPFPSKSIYSVPATKRTPLQVTSGHNFQAEKWSPVQVVSLNTPENRYSAAWKLVLCHFN